MKQIHASPTVYQTPWERGKDSTCYLVAAGIKDGIPTLFYVNVTIRTGDTPVSDEQFASYEEVERHSRLQDILDLLKKYGN